MPQYALIGLLLLVVTAGSAAASYRSDVLADWAQGNNSRIHAWYRIATASEPDSYTFVLSGGGDDISGGILALENASQGSPINASGGQSNGSTASTSVSAPSITTTVTNTLLVFAGSCASAATYTPPVGMTERWDTASSGTYKIGSEVATAVVGSAGPTGVRTAIASSSCKSVGIQIAVAPG